MPAWAAYLRVARVSLVAKQVAALALTAAGMTTRIYFSHGIVLLFDSSGVHRGTTGRKRTPLRDLLVIRRQPTSRR
jgi:hypothetical protein